MRGNGASFFVIQLRGSAAGLDYLHSWGIVHGNGESDGGLTNKYDLTLPQSNA